MKRIFLLLTLALGIAAAQAQIPAEVSQVMAKCRAAMTNASGLEYEMDMKTGVGLLSMKMHFVIAEKGNMRRNTMTMNVMGEDITVESGFDGTDTWEIKQSDKRDTIIFTPGDTRKKSKGDISLDLDGQYRKAKMKHKEGFYEITFTDPIDKKNSAKSITAKISDKNHTLCEMHTNTHGAKVTMTITHIRVGLKDSHFKPNLSQYPDAVVIRN